MTSYGPKIIVIIPAYNEQETIASVVDQVKQYTKKIIVIDDGSTDNTAANADASGAQVISNTTNRGLGITVRIGYEAALKSDAEIIVQVDADGQYTIEDIPALIKPISENRADMVLASRIKGGIEEMPLKKRIGNGVGTLLTRLVSGCPVSDSQTGFRAMRRELLEEVLPTGGYTYVQEMIIRASKEGWRISEVPSFFKKRRHGQSRLISSIAVYAVKAIAIIFRTMLEYHPLSRTYRKRHKTIK